jgi:DNA-binding MurR/RpiR family transcriptional regulator
LEGINMQQLGKKIQEHFFEMSPKQKKIAEYISNNYDKAVFQTAKQLSREVGVSEATVVRFAVVLGYDGYPQLVKAMSEMVRDRITTVERLEFSLKTPQGSILKDVMEHDIANIKLTLEELDLPSFLEAVKSMTRAKHIYIVAQRSAASLGTFLHFYLQILLKNSRLITKADTLFEDLASVGPDDLVIGISFRRYTRQTVEGMSFCREKGARTIAITDDHTSALVQHSSIVLLAKRDMSTFIDSFVAPLSLINALIVAVGTERPKHTRQTLAEFEAIWQKQNIYHKD